MLQGNVPFKEIVKDKNMIKRKDLLLSKLLMNCLYITGLKYNRQGNLLSLGFDEHLNFGEGNDVYLYFVMEILEHPSTKTYVCNTYAKCIGNGQDLFNEKLNKPIMPYNKLVEFINKESLDLLIEFTKFTERTFDFKSFPFTNRKDVSDFTIQNLQGTLGVN